MISPEPATNLRMIPVYLIWQPSDSPLVSAASKKGGGGGLKFEAEATAHLQNSGVPVTDDKPKYEQQDAATRLLAILSEGGFVQSTEVAILYSVKLYGFYGFWKNTGILIELGMNIFNHSVCQGA